MFAVWIARVSTRGVQDVGQQPRLAQQLARARGFGLAELGEPDVHPTGEQVLLVPFAVAVAEQHQGVSHANSLPARHPVA